MIRIVKCLQIGDFLKAVNILPPEKLYIVGAGRFGEIIGEYFDKHKISWMGYIDKTDNRKLNGKIVYSYQKCENSQDYYLISSYDYRKEMEEELLKWGVPSDHIIIYENQNFIFKLFDDLIGWKKYTQRTKRFHKKYTGERCFVIGNGPSLTISDLEKLKDEITFAANSIYSLYNETDWRPTYYCAWDSIFSKEMMSDKGDIKKITDGCEAAFLSVIGEGIQYRDDIDMQKLYYICAKTKSSDDGLSLFSTDISKCVYAAGSVSYAMIQLAVYMGLKKIYLLGMDCCYSLEKHADGTLTENNVSNYMEQIDKEEERYRKKFPSLMIPDIDSHFACHRSAKKYADANGIEIYNATRGGALEIFERVNFDELF